MSRPDTNRLQIWCNITLSLPQPGLQGDGTVLASLILCLGVSPLHQGEASVLRTETLFIELVLSYTGFPPSI